jgi:signal transduction histidine kinase
MVQEAVCNAVKHSRARHIRINLQQSKSQIQLTVSDDGCGFHKDSRSPRYSQKSDGLGLRIMQHRASLIGARLSIQSKPGEGTQVCFFLLCPTQKTTAKKRTPDGKSIRRP